MKTKFGEFALIDWIRARASTNEKVALGIGDDCAVVDGIQGKSIVVTTDMLMDGRHFILDQAGAAAVGRKALGVNLSDIAAMAARPFAAFVAVALPKSGANEIAQGIFEGMNPLARRFGVSLAGGDTNVWNGPLVVCVTVLGEATDRGAVRRSSAKPGDIVFVTGPLGGSFPARHLDPQPRIDEALLLADTVKLHSMIDISDGLAADLSHILDESGGLGAIFDVDSIPIHEDARLLSRQDGTSALAHALSDGEDFELCFTVSVEDAKRLADHPPEGLKLHRVGEVVTRPGLRLREANGSVRDLDLKGFDHFDS